jgi:hypothetical protein
MAVTLTRAFHIKLERPGWEYNFTIASDVGIPKGDEKQIALWYLIMMLDNPELPGYDKVMLGEFLLSRGLRTDVTITVKETTCVDAQVRITECTCTDQLLGTLDYDGEEDGCDSRCLDD